MTRHTFFIILTLGILLVGHPARAGKRQDHAVEIDAARVRARAWLIQHGSTLGITDPDTQLRETSAQVLKVGIVLRYRQIYEGVPVYRASLILSVTERDVRSTSGVVVGIRAETRPSVTADRAAAIAIGKRKLKAKPEILETTLLVVPRYALGDVPANDRLAWEVTLATDNDVDGATSRRIIVDALTCEILADDDDIVHATYILTWPRAEGAYVDRSVRAVGELNKPKNGLSKMYLHDPCYGHGQPITPGEWSLRCSKYDENLNYFIADGLGNWVGNANGKFTFTAKPLEFLSTTIGDGQLGSSNVQTPAADAMAAIETAFDYLFFTFDRVGLDHNNGPQIRALVRVPLGANAAWSSKHRAIQIGNGNIDHYDAAAVDIVAHELGHALSDFGPQLESRGEPGEVAEGAANMFAMLVSEYSDYDPVPHWIGEKVVKRNYVGSMFSEPTIAFTYLDDPARKPGTVACYYPDIGSLENHRGAGPADHMFYLLTYGGTSTCNGNVVAAIGVEAAAQIWYAGFHQLPETATYASLRQVFVSSAMQLFPGPSVIVQSTAAAFDAVNVP